MQQSEPGLILSFAQYQARSRATAFYPHMMEGCHPEAITYVTLGLTGEAGEFSDTLKKTWREERGFHVLSESRRLKLLDELGDLMWYAAQAASELGVALEQVCAWNLEKLAARAEHGASGWDEDRKYQVLKGIDRHVGMERLEDEAAGS